MKRLYQCHLCQCTRPHGYLRALEWSTKFGALLDYSGTKMASIMVETIGALKEAIELTEAPGIDEGEREHIEHVFHSSKRNVNTCYHKLA